MGEHWYTKTGESAYGYSVDDARKKSLYPSVTTILGVLAKPGLEYWKQEQAVITSLKIPKESSEDDKTYAKRVLKEFRENQFSATVGTMIHDFCEKLHNPMIDGYEEICKKIRDWQASNIAKFVAEESFTYDDIGYGGRIDCYGIDVNGKRFILDYKTQAPKKGELTVYDEWIYQLAAYSKGDTSIRHISVMISSDKDQPILETHEWSKEAIEDGYRVFNAAKVVWYSKNRF